MHVRTLIWCKGASRNTSWHHKKNSYPNSATEPGKHPMLCLRVVSNAALTY